MLKVCWRAISNHWVSTKKETFDGLCLVFETFLRSSTTSSTLRFFNFAYSGTRGSHANLFADSKPTKQFFTVPVSASNSQWPWGSGFFLKFIAGQQKFWFLFKSYQVDRLRVKTLSGLRSTETHRFTFYHIEQINLHILKWIEKASSIRDIGCLCGQ